jgi:hypothetical protein
LGGKNIRLEIYDSLWLFNVVSQHVGEGYFLLVIEYKSEFGSFIVQIRSYIEGLGYNPQDAHAVKLVDVIGVAVVSRYKLHILASECEPVHEWVRVFWQ